MVSSLAEVKYLESDDFDHTIRVYSARLVTLSVRIIARCGSLHLNPTIFRCDFDILIADFGRDLTRIQARLIFEFGLYAAGRRDFSASICDRLVFATLRYSTDKGDDVHCRLQKKACKNTLSYPAA